MLNYEDYFDQFPDERGLGGATTAPNTNTDTSAHPWTDPDNAPPSWLYDPTQHPPGDAGPGNYWDFSGGMWIIRQMPRAPVPNLGPTTAPNTNTDTIPLTTANTGGGGGSTVGSGPDYSQMLPYSPYQAYGRFTPRNGTFTVEPFVDDAPFSYEAYKPSSYADLENQPGFAESQNRLRKEIEAGAAYRGVVRSGMTLGDLWTGLDTNKAQRFADFDNRRFRDYSANRANAFDTYRTNRNNRLETWTANLGANRNKFLDEYGIDRDVYDRGAAENERFNNYRYNTERDSFADALARWTEQVRSLTSISTAGANT